MDELQPAIDRQNNGEADLVPIVCDHVDLGPLAAHQCLPQDEKNDLKPLCDWPNPNLPLAKCAGKIRALVEARRPPPPRAAAQPAPTTAPAPAQPSAPATPSLSERMAAAVAAKVGGFLGGLLRATLGTATIPRLPRQRRARRHPARHPRRRKLPRLPTCSSAVRPTSTSSCSGSSTRNASPSPCSAPAASARQPSPAPPCATPAARAISLSTAACSCRLEDVRDAAGIHLARSPGRSALPRRATGGCGAVGTTRGAGAGGPRQCRDPLGGGP